MENKKYDLIIVGAGIVGLATAYEFNKRDPNKKVLILDKESKIASHQTGRNSGVIHSGIYYKPNSLKAENCLNGYNFLLDFAKEFKIPFKITGKIIVAFNNNQIQTLNTLYENGKKNGLKNLKILDRKEIISKEPSCKNAVKALYVPQSGIIDYKQVSEKLVEFLKENNVSINLAEEVKEIKNKKNKVEIYTQNEILETNHAIICCGVHSDKFISNKMKNKFRVLPFKGEYFKLKNSSKKLVNGLIYPVPNLNFPFLGVHLTKTINGDVEAGPNAVLSLSREGYEKFAFNFWDFISIISWKGFWIFALKYWRVGLYELFRSFSKNSFKKALQILVPDIKSNSLEEGKSGIRAQIITNKGDLLDDFLIDHQMNLINVINAPSPAATSSFAIAKKIIDKISK